MDKGSHDLETRQMVIELINRGVIKLANCITSISLASLYIPELKQKVFDNKVNMAVELATMLSTQVIIKEKNENIQAGTVDLTAVIFYLDKEFTKDWEYEG